MIERIKNTDSDFWARAGLWIVLLFAVASSIEHVAAMFGNGDKLAGLMPALAIDGGLALSTYGLGRFDNKWVKTGFWVFLILSIFANLDYSLQRLMGGAVVWDYIWRIDTWQLIKAVAQASPPLIGAMMMEINVAIAKQEKPAAVGAELATVPAPVGNKGGEPPAPPAVNVAPPVGKKPANSDRKLGNRTYKRIGKQPTMPRLTAADVANEDVPELLFEDAPDLATWQPANPAAIQGTPIPKSDLDHDLTQAVILYAQEGSYAKAARRLGGTITSEGMRQRVISAYQNDPAWVAQILPTDKLPKS